MMSTKILGCVAAILAGTGTAARAADNVSVGVTADLFSKYIWRGQNVVDDWVLQPGASIGYKGLTGSIWANVDLTGDLVGAWEFSEVDYILDYTGKFPGQETFGYSLGLAHYDFPNTPWEPTSEVYGGLTAAVPLSPALRWYYDFDEADGSYLQLSAGHTVEKLRRWRDTCYCDLQLGASLGYATDNFNAFYFGVDGSAFNDLTLTAGLPICIGKLTIRPSLGYSIMIDDDIRAATGKSDNFWGGLGLAYNF